MTEGCTANEAELCVELCWGQADDAANYKPLKNWKWRKNKQTNIFYVYIIFLMMERDEIL